MEHPTPDASEPDPVERPRRRGAAAAVAAALIALGARRLQRVEVEGRSMLPALAPGDRLLVVRGRRVRAGQVVAVPDPRAPDRALIKRVAAVDRSGVTVLGDNAPESTDSRTFGPVRRRDVTGVAVYRYAPAGRTGRLRAGPSAPPRQ